MGAECVEGILKAQTIAEAEAVATMLGMAARLLKAPVSVDDLVFFRQVELDDPTDPVCMEKCVRAGLSAMQGFARSSDDADDLRLQASNDFHRMFVGPGHKLCPPWSSVYLDGKGLVNGPTAQQVKAVFKSHGLAVPAGNREPWDHMGFELQFVADLLQRGLVSLEAGDCEGTRSAFADARDFTERFIKPWSDTFFSDVERESRVGFYRGFAVMSQGLIDWEFRATACVLAEL